MALNESVEQKLNEQINAEFWSAYLYLSMSNYLSTIGMPGFAKWMRVQYEEETFHAMKLIDYINERNGKVVLKPIASVPIEWHGVMDVFKEALEHEEYITQLINECADVALDVRDHASMNFLQWFVNEQVEEEASVHELLDQLRLTGDKGNGLFVLDKEAATRVFTPPTV
jgi:ferritin